MSPDLEPFHKMLFSVIPQNLFLLGGGLIPLCKAIYTQHILKPIDRINLGSNAYEYVTSVYYVSRSGAFSQDAV